MLAHQVKYVFNTLLNHQGLLNGRIYTEGRHCPDLLVFAHDHVELQKLKFAVLAVSVKLQPLFVKVESGVSKLPSPNGR